jgi:hypothetical protein
MIALLSNLPDHVVGFIASGQVTATDYYESEVIPAIESKLKKHGKVSILNITNQPTDILVF